VPALMIDDPWDPRLNPFRSLKATNETRGRPEFVVEGRRLVDRLLASPHTTLAVLAREDQIAGLEQRIPGTAAFYGASKRVLSELVGFPFHQGVLAHARRAPVRPLQEFLRREGRLSLVVCPRISNPENLGAIVRIADVLGVDAILSGPSCPEPFSRRVMRVSMGSALHLPVIQIAEEDAELTRLLASSRIEILGAVADPRASPFIEYTPPDRFALVLGEEDQGLSADWAAVCGRCLTIPMRPGASSLNVAVAAGILLEHLTRPSRLCDG
jgi:tRNA G18 (ribose-2'-O)-methylase SpoU